MDLASQIHQHHNQRLMIKIILVQKPQPGATFARLAEVLDEIRALPALDWSRGHNQRLMIKMDANRPGAGGIEAHRHRWLSPAAGAPRH
jgi:hypothetical protein